MRRLVLLLLLALLAARPGLAADESTADPKPVPAITFQDHDGHTLGLDAFKGKVVLLDFWATWCPPCRAEFPDLDAIQGNLGDKGLAVVAVSLDRGGMAAVDRFYTEHHVAHMGRFHDADGGSVRALGVNGMPTAILIDRQGREVARFEGAVAWTDPAIVALVQRLLDAS